MDLEEYCIDPNNVAPVRSEEIFTFWKSLFKVAEAIKTVHHLRIQSGKTWKHYSGYANPPAFSTCKAVLTMLI